MSVLRNGESYQSLEQLDATSFVDTKVENGKVYTYQITLKDKAGNEVKSNMVSVSPKSAVTAAVEGFLGDDLTVDEASQQLVNLVLEIPIAPEEVKDLLVASALATNDTTLLQEDKKMAANEKQIVEFADGIQRDLEKLQKELAKKNVKKDKEIKKAEKKVAHNLEKIKKVVQK